MQSLLKMFLLRLLPPQHGWMGGPHGVSDNLRRFIAKHWEQQRYFEHVYTLEGVETCQKRIVIPCLSMTHKNGNLTNAIMFQSIGLRFPASFLFFPFSACALGI